MVKFLFSILSLCFACCAQAQNPEISVTPTTVEAGQTFNIVILYYQDEELAMSWPKEFDKNNNFVKESFRKKDPKTKKWITVNRRIISGSIDKPGTYELGPVFVKNENISLPSNKVSIEVKTPQQMHAGHVTTKQLNEPAFGVVEVNKTEIYEGEALVVNAKCYTRARPPFMFTNYIPYQVPATTTNYTLSNEVFSRARIETFKGHKHYASIADKKILYPSGIGLFQVDPFRVNFSVGYRGFTVISNKQTIKVKPLPANPPPDFIGGVGNLDIGASLDHKKFKQGEVFKMIVTISGTGNLYNLSEPSLHLPKDLMVYGDPIREENIGVSVTGAQGSVQYTYNIEVKGNGSIETGQVSFSYFDPQQEKYITKKSNNLSIEAKPNQQYAKNNTDEEPDVRSEEVVIHRSDMRKNPRIVSIDSIYGSSLFWGSISSPIAFAFLFIFFSKYKEKTAEKTAIKQQIKTISNEYNDHLKSVNSIAQSGSDDQFYSHVEKTLKKAFEIEMHFRPDELISKSLMLDYLNKKDATQLASEVKTILETCEASKYGFGVQHGSREDLINQLKKVCNSLAKVSKS